MISVVSHGLEVVSVVGVKRCKAATVVGIQLLGVHVNVFAG